MHTPKVRKTNFPRKEVHILFSTFKTIHTARWHKRKEGTCPFHKHTMLKHQNIPKETGQPACSNCHEIRKNQTSHLNSKGFATHVPSPSYLSPHPSSCCQSPSTVRKRLCCCDNSTRELLWHSEHKERGEPRDSELHLARIPHLLALEVY